MISHDSVMRVAREAALHDANVRAMRDRVYGRPSTDANWLACRDGWMTEESVQWLKDQCALLDAKHTP